MTISSLITLEVYRLLGHHYHCDFLTVSSFGLFLITLIPHISTSETHRHRPGDEQSGASSFLTLRILFGTISPSSCVLSTKVLTAVLPISD